MKITHEICNQIKKQQTFRALNEIVGFIVNNQVQPQTLAEFFNVIYKNHLSV